MNKILILLAVSAFLFSCQKEINFPTGPGGTPGATGTLLIREVTTVGSDSAVTILTYDVNKRLIRLNVTGIVSGVDNTDDYQVIRNSNGIITQTVEKSPSLSMVGIDSSVRTIYYDPGAKKYTAASQLIDIPGLTGIDSSVYVYAGNKVTEQDEYFAASGFSLLVAKIVYVYNAQSNNITATHISYVDSSFVLTPALDYAFTFDNKTNALVMPNEAFVLDRFQYFNANNPLSFSITDLSSSTTITRNYTYQYNSNNLPNIGIATITPGNDTETTNYYYK